MSVNKIYFKLRREVDNQFLQEIARREITWLVKDKLGNKGWKFVRARVEPTEKEGYDYRVLTKRKVPLNQIADRIVYTEEIYDCSKNKKYDCNCSFWEQYILEDLEIYDFELQDLALLNIIHPYQHGNIFNYSSQTIYSINEDSEIESVTALISGFSEEEIRNELSSYMDDISEMLLPGGSRTNKSMGDLPLETGALTGTKALLKLKTKKDFSELYNFDRPPGLIPINKIEENINLDSKIVEEAEKRDLALNLHLHDMNSNIYLTFMKHPRCSNTKRIEKNEGSYDGAFEIRKFKLIENIRSNLYGYKGFDEGEIKKLVYENKEGWKVYLFRPGFKDCEDFYVELHAPEDEDKSIVFSEKEPKPAFTKIFSESKTYFENKETDKIFTKAIYEIWKAKRDILDIIDEYSSKLRSKNIEFNYNPEGFLLMIHYLYLVEDINYRFWYHPPSRGYLYRKLGRNDPFNGFLNIKAGNHDLLSEAKNIAMIERPERFRGEYQP